MIILKNRPLSKLGVISALFSLLAAGPANAQGEINFDDLLVGTHLLSLHWISLEYFGHVRITKQKGDSYKVVGGQRSRENSDYLAIQGVLVPQSPTELLFTGRIVTYVASWGPEACVRLGVFSFQQPEGRKYWRLQQKDSPCNSGTDYIDIYIKRMN